MKKFFKSLALYSLPFLLALAALFALEPSDYLGLRGDATYLSRPLSSMREIMRDKPARLIFGDSRMANLSVSYIESVSGESYCSAAFGGSTFGEQAELFRFCTRYAVPERVVFGVDFYMCRGYQDAGRIPSVEREARSVYAFATDFGNWLRAADSLRWKGKNAAARALGREDWLEYPEDPTDYTIQPVLTDERVDGDRADLAAYAATIYGGIQDYSLDESTLTQLQEIIDYCGEHGTELIFVIPPMHETVFRLATGPSGVDPYRERLLEFLRERATVYDLQFINDFTSNEDNFYDGFHLVPEQKMTLARLIFTDTDEHPEAIHRYVKD